MTKRKKGARETQLYELAIWDLELLKQTIQREIHTLKTRKTLDKPSVGAPHYNYVTAITTNMTDVVLRAGRLLVHDLNQ